MNKVILIAAILFSATFTFAQQTEPVSLQVMGQDGEMMASLPYAEVSLSSGEVVRTDVNGFVNLSAEEIASAEYVVIRSAGYDDTRIELASLEDQSINKVRLTPRSLPIFTASKEN